MSRLARRVGFAALIALALLAGAVLPSLRSEPVQAQQSVNLVLPALSVEELAAWCDEHNTSEFRAKLSSIGRNWIRGCDEVLTVGAATPSPSPSSTPTPSPTSTPDGCLSLPSVCGFPDATNTGVPAGTSLTVVTGNVTLSTAGMVYEGKDVRGCITVTAPNVVIRESRITCVGDYVKIRSQSTGLMLSDVEIDCGSDYGHAVAYANYTLIRANIHHCENGADVSSPGNVTIRDSYIHDLWSGGTAHSDGMQFGQGAGNIVVRHNTIRGGNTSAVIMWDEGGSQNHDVLVDGNLMAGGAYTLYCPRQDATNVRVTGNRFGPYVFGYANSCVPGHVAQWSGNVRDSDGAALPAT